MPRFLVALLVLLVGALAQAQTPPTAQQKQAAKAHFQQGRAYYEAGAWDDAVREYEAAFALVPLPDLLFNIGQALRMKNDKPKAIAAYQRYLDRLPDGALADEARNHIAALRLKIQVEEAEAARKKAVEEAEAARRRATEAEAARQRSEAEAAARLHAQQGDDERLRRVAADEAERTRRKKAADEAAEQQRIEETAGIGRGLRVTGIVTASVGVAALGLAALGYWVAMSNRFRAFDRFNSGNNFWQPSDVDLSGFNAARNLVVASVAIGATLLATGVTLYVWGRVRRAHVVEKLLPITLVPAIGPSTGMLAVGGRF